MQETTALGAAYLAGLAEGVWASTDDVRDNWQLDAEFEPAADAAAADAKYAQWRRAVERARHWEPSADGFGLGQPTEGWFRRAA